MAIYTIRFFPHEVWSMLVLEVAGMISEKMIADFDKSCLHRHHKGGIPMKITIEPTLYLDPQAVKPAGYCPVCGGALYNPSLVCLRCERRGGE